MKLRLNLATAPVENHRPFAVGAGAIGLAGIVALLLLAHSAYRSWNANRETRADISRLQDQIVDLERKQQALGKYFQTPGAKQVMDRSAFLNSMIQERSFPWTKIFVDLEKTLPPGVRVVSISPHLDKGRVSVKLMVGALNNEGKIKFLEALENSKEFSGIEVLQERPNDLTNLSQDRVVVELEAWYETASI